MNPRGGDDPLSGLNINLPYGIKVYFSSMHVVLSADSAEVFEDEHGVQWIKFVATNGPELGKEHMLRTDQVVLVREGQ